MSYEHRSNVKSNNISLSIKIVIGILIIAIPLQLFLPKFLPNIFTFFVSPFWNMERSIRNSDNDPDTELRNALISELRKENEELKSLSHASTSPSSQHFAYIYKKPPFTVYDSYIIDIKSFRGAKVGDKVYTAGNILLGEIVEKNGTLAKVKLYSSYGEKYDVLIGKNNIQTTATGRGGGSFEVTLPKDVKIKEGDNVIVPDFSPSIFGVVKNVSIDPARAFATILFSQPVNIYELKWVVVRSND